MAYTDRSLTILVVDDDSGMRQLLRDILAPLGHTVVEADNGKQVETLCEASGPDVVILDLLMPEQDGLETLKIVRRNFPAIRTVVMSGKFQDVYLRTARLMGADTVLPKPFSISDLLRSLKP